MKKIIAAVFVASVAVYGLAQTAQAAETWEQYQRARMGAEKYDAANQAATCQAWEQGAKEERREAEMVAQFASTSHVNDAAQQAQWSKQRDLNLANAKRLDAKVKAQCSS
jgi:hypothetical protein